MRFSLGIRFEAFASASSEGVVENEIQGQKVVRFVTIDWAKTDFLEMLFNSVRGQFPFQDGVDFWRIGDNTDIASIPFVTGSCVREFGKWDSHKGIPMSFITCGKQE